MIKKSKVKKRAKVMHEGVPTKEALEDFVFITKRIGWQLFTEELIRRHDSIKETMFDNFLKDKIEVSKVQAGIAQGLKAAASVVPSHLLSLADSPSLDEESEAVDSY